MRNDLMLALASLVLNTPCLAQVQDVYTMADWLRRPTREELIGVWPTKALSAPIDGRATISCIVTVHGGLRACTVASESPEGVGFGNAAIALTPQFLFKPATKNGIPLESPITIPIHFPKLDRDLKATLGRVDEFDQT